MKSMNFDTETLGFEFCKIRSIYEKKYVFLNYTQDMYNEMIMK